MSIALIHVRFALPGWHCWPGAPPHRAYLAAKHRHLFNVEVTTGVTHNDREIEFHDLADEARAVFEGLQGRDGDLGPMSCEMIAHHIASVLVLRHARPVTVSVWEDKESGSTVTVKPKENGPG